jgi:hypothetical protein
MNDGQHSGPGDEKPSFRVEGFRAPIGVLNPDVYDPRIGMLWAMGISVSAGSLLSAERYLAVAHAGPAMCVAGGGAMALRGVLAPQRRFSASRRQRT